jgi:hypothetical protein
VAQVLEHLAHLPSKCEALNSVSSTAKKKEKPDIDRLQVVGSLSSYQLKMDQGP